MLAEYVHMLICTTYKLDNNFNLVQGFHASILRERESWETEVFFEPFGA